MVEPWSSKSYVWVRFLLPLLSKNKNFKNNIIKLQKLKIIPILNKNKYFNKNIFIKNLFHVTLNLSFAFFKLPKLTQNYLITWNNNYFFYFKNFSFLKKTPNILSTNDFLFFYRTIARNNYFYIFHFFCLYNAPAAAFFKISNILYKKYYYFFYYLNSFLFLNKNTQSLEYFFNNNTKKHVTIFHNFRNKKQQHTSLKIKNLQKRTGTISTVIKNFNPFKINYPFLTKLFFLNFKIFLKLKKKQLISFFKLNSFDWINDDLARLTKQTFLLDFSDYFYYKNANINSCFYNNKLNNILDYSNYSDNFFENNTLFIIHTNTTRLFKFSIFENILNTDFRKLTNSLTKSTNFIIYRKIVEPTYSINNFDFRFFKNSTIFANKFELLLFLFTKPIFFKYFSLTKSLNNFFNFNSLHPLINHFSDYFFYNKNTLFFNNFLPVLHFSYKIKKYILKIFNYNKFSVTTSLWCYTTLIKFLEFFSGKKIHLRFRPFINNILNFQEKAQCLLWAQKVKYYRKMLGPRLFLNESLQIIYLSLKYKDPFILSNWMSATMQKISFWKYKTFLRYIKYVLRYFFWVIFKQLNVKGIKYQLKGKVSVAGNARTRTVFHTIGFTSHTTFNNKILYKLNLVKTFTGVLGFKLWIVF